MLRTDRIRADTTVVAADVGYPTDSGLLAQAVGTMCRTVARIKAAGAARRTQAVTTPFGGAACPCDRF